MDRPKIDGIVDYIKAAYPDSWRDYVLCRTGTEEPIGLCFHIWVEYITRRLCLCSRKPVRMVVTLENKMFFNPLCLSQYKNEKVQMDSPKKKAVGEKIVVDAEDLLSIARDLESSSNIVHINGKEYTGKKSWITNRLREIVASAPINR